MDALAEGPHKFTVDGITFSYVVSGAGPLLVVQSVGWGASSSYLREGLRDLESEFKILYFEPRGNGDSSRPESASAMGTKDMAYDLEHLREHLQLPSFTALLGHSHGGAIALAYAERFPTGVTKLVLVNHELQTFSSDTAAVFAAERKDHPVYGPAFQSLVGLSMNPPSTNEEFSSGMVKASPYFFADTSKTEIFQLGSLSVWTFLAQSSTDKVSPFPHVAELGNVKAETLILVGREDALLLCNVAAAERTREGIEGSRLVVWEDCGHMPWIEKTEEFFEVVTKFLKG